MKLCGKENPTEKDEEKFLELQDKIAQKSPGYSPDLTGVLYKQELNELGKKIAKEFKTYDEFVEYLKTLDSIILDGMYSSSFDYKILKNLS